MVHTIGHSSHPLGRFLDLLGLHGIQAVVDVRSHPRSRWAPHFNKDALSHSLESHGIAYVFLGRELGGRPDGQEFYDESGKLDCERRSSSPDFQAGIDRLIQIAHSHPTAIMCAEEDPDRCHRRMLITPVLLRHEVTVLHIRGDGRLQSESEPSREGAQRPLF